MLMKMWQYKNPNFDKDVQLGPFVLAVSYIGSKEKTAVSGIMLLTGFRKTNKRITETSESSISECPSCYMDSVWKSLTISYHIVLVLLCYHPFCEISTICDTLPSPCYILVNFLIILKEISC